MVEKQTCRISKSPGKELTQPFPMHSAAFLSTKIPGMGINGITIFCKMLLEAQVQWSAGKLATLHLGKDLKQEYRFGGKTALYFCSSRSSRQQLVLQNGCAILGGFSLQPGLVACFKAAYSPLPRKTTPSKIESQSMGQGNKTYGAYWSPSRLFDLACMPRLGHLSGAETNHFRCNLPEEKLYWQEKVCGL